MTAPAWPETVLPYRRTDVFTAETVPAALTRAHATRPGTWARLHVLDGRLMFRDLVSGAETALDLGVHPLIHPGRLHEVAPMGEVRFFVEFCRLPEDDATTGAFAVPRARP